MDTNSTKWVLGHKVTPHDTAGNYDLLMGETPAKMQGPPPHLHKTYDESFLIIEGQMDFFVNGEKIIVHTGDSVNIPAHTTHTFANNSDQPCRWINIHSPKGFRIFFETMGINSEEEQSFEQSLAPELIQEVIRTAEDFDMIIKT